MSQNDLAPFQPNRLAQKLLELCGWKCSFNSLPGPRGVIIFYPHTSNWDFCMGILARWAMGVQFKFLAKHTLFKIPVFGAWLASIGGIPVIRHSPQGYVQDLVQTISSAPYFWLVIAPEGTRRKTTGWRSGFYQVALQAQIPIGLAYLDYRKKEVGLSTFFTPSGDADKDLIFLRDFYEDKIGCHPHHASPIQFWTPPKP